MFKELFTEAEKAKIKITTENLLNMRKVCGNYVPVRVQSFSSEYNTTYIAKKMLAGYHMFKLDAGSNTDYVIISPESLARCSELYALVTSKEGTNGSFKVGRKTYKVSTRNMDRSQVLPYVDEMTILGETLEPVVKSKLPSSVTNTIKSGIVINSMHVPLSVKYVEAWYDSDPDEEINFYMKKVSDGWKMLLRSSWDIAKGKDFVIFGQQHATKDNKFKYISAGDYVYKGVSKSFLMPPRAYKKSNISDRSQGVYVAK